MSALRRRRVAFAFLGGLALVTTTPAYADTPAERRGDNRARAQQLFDSALTDAEAGNFAAACPKFLASQEADPKTSTLLNLANCYEKNGQTASAWGAFREAEGLARKANRADWESSAQKRAEALEPRLVRLSIVVAPASRVPGLQVSRDGARVTAGEWGVAIPVDPGEHVIAASAEGRSSWEQRFPTTDQSVTIEVPVLEALPAPPVTATVPMAPPDLGSTSRWSTLQRAGAITGGVGALGMIVGGVLGLVAKGAYDDARDRCTSGAKGCPSGAVADADSAYGTATAATVVFVSGAVLLAGGATLFLVAPRTNKSTQTGTRGPRPSIALSPVGVFGRW